MGRKKVEEEEETFQVGAQDYGVLGRILTRL